MQEKTREAENELIDALQDLGWDVEEIRIQEDGERIQYSSSQIEKITTAVDVEVKAEKRFPVDE